MITLQKKIKGFTLLEVMLVLAIASSLFVLLMNYTTQKADELRRDKTVLQMQQILNAGMSFYLNKSFWPLVGATIDAPGCGTTTWTALSVLQPNYLPSTMLNNSYGNPYYINCNTAVNGGGFYVAVKVNNATNASIIAGRLPMAYTSSTGLPAAGSAPPPTACQGATCTTVVANVNIPGQNLNNARSVNFAAVYNSGSCVPAPNCPPNMKASIVVMPAAIAGVNDPPACTTAQGPCIRWLSWDIAHILPCQQYAVGPTTCTPSKAYPVSSFTAYAYGISNTNGDAVSPDKPRGCSSPSATPCLAKMDGTKITTTDGTKYWRVCLSVNTEKGPVTPTTNNQGVEMGTIVALTRCVPNMGNEQPSGSISVWQQ